MLPRREQGDGRGRGGDPDRARGEEGFCVTLAHCGNLLAGQFLENAFFGNLLLGPVPENMFFWRTILQAWVVARVEGSSLLAWTGASKCTPRLAHLCAPHGTSPPPQGEGGWGGILQTNLKATVAILKIP